MVHVALAAVVFAVGIDLGRRWRLVQFETVRYVENEPLADPVRVVGIDGCLFVLEDGREVRFDADPDLSGVLSEDQSGRCRFPVDVEVEDGGSAKVYAKRRLWFCGNCSREARLCIPIATRTVPLNRRELIGAGRIAGGGNTRAERRGHPE
jgi:hypothetical protein